jgi:alpha-glucosidase
MPESTDLLKPITRRGALKKVATAGGGALVGSKLAFSQETQIQVAGRPVEIALTATSPKTVRVTIAPIENGQVQPLPVDGALVKQNWGRPVARLRTLANTTSVKCGELIVRLSGNPLAIHIGDKAGRVAQQLTCDSATGELSFRTGESPLLGLGQGGPQFDRRGHIDRMGSGQGGYQLATHGGKVPVQLLIGTSGWAMYIHQPLGAFDLTGKDGLLRATNPQASLPLDLFVIGAQEPAAILREYAGITGYAEMPPLWSFGYQQSHRTLGPPEEIRSRSKNVPGQETSLRCDDLSGNGLLSKRLEHPQR